MKKKIYFFFAFIIISVMLFSSCANVENPVNDGTESETAAPVSTHVHSDIKTETTALIPVHERDANNIDRQLASEIKTAYCKLIWETKFGGEARYYTPSDFAVSFYGGKIGECHIVKMYEKGLQYTQMTRTVEVAGYYLTFANSQLLYAYYEGSFYTIKEAYEIGLLSREAVYRIGTEFCVDILPIAADTYG